MIPYDEFKALPVTEADAICAEKMGWHSEAVSDESGCRLWMNADDRFVIAEDDWSPTTDRNDAAMMVEQVRDCGRMPDLLMPIMLEGLPNSFLEAVEIGLCADPCLIAWAACVALEEA